MPPECVISAINSDYYRSSWQT